MPTIEERKFELKQNFIYVNGKKLNNYDRVEILCDMCGISVSKEVKRFKKFYNEYQKCLCQKHQMEFIHMMKYGVKNCMMNKKVQEKAQKTQKNNNNGKLAFNTEKQKKTMLDRYGVLYSGQSKELLKKAQNTNLERYGNISSLGNKDIINKSEDTKKARYGNKKYNNKNKAINTMIEKYGVDTINICKWYDIGGQKVQGKFELSLAEFLIENNINFIAHRGLGKIQYIKEDGKQSVYIPDFYLPDFDLYLEPHAQYYWDEYFKWKMNEIKKQVDILFFDESFDFNIILEVLNAYN